MSADSLIGITEAELGADHLDGVSAKTVAGYRALYGWPHVKIARRVYYTPDHVAQIVRAHTVAGGKVAPKDGRTEKSAARSRGG